MNFSDHVLKMGNHVAIIEERLDECDTYDPTHLNAENIVHENKRAAENDNENHSSFKSIDQIQDLAESEDQSENHKRINGYVSSPDPHSHEGVMDRKDTSTAQHNMPIASMKDQSIAISDDNLFQVGIPISETEGNLMESERNCILKPNNHNVNSSTTTTSELESPVVRDSSSDNGEIQHVKSKAQNGGNGSENIHISPLSRHLEKANDKQKGSSVKLKCDSKLDGTFSKPLPKEMAMPEAKDAALENAEASNIPVIVSNDSKYSKVNANHINDDALIQPVKHKSSSFMKASEIPTCTSKKKLKSNLMTKQIEVDIVQKKLDSPDKNGRIVLKQVTQDDRGSLKKNKLSICNSSQVNDLTPEKSYHKNVSASILENKPNIHKPRISVLVNGTDNKKSCTDGLTGPHQEYKQRAVLEKKRKDVCRSLKSSPAKGKKLNEKRINSIISQVISSGSGPIQLNCLNSNKVSNTDADPSASLDNMHVIPSKDNDTTKAITSVKVPEKAKLGVKKSKMFLPRDNGYSKNRACNEQSFRTEMVHKSKKLSVISKSGSVVISKKRFGIKKPNTSSLLARKGENGNHISLSESSHHHPCQIKFKKKLSSNVKKNQSHVIGLKETPSALSKQHNSSHHTSEIKNKVENNDVIAPTLNGMFPNSDENPDESTSAHIQRKCEQPLSHEPASKTASKCQSRENEICRTLRVSEIRNTKDNKISLTLSRCVSSPNQHKKANYSIVPKATSPLTQTRKTISKHQGYTNHENYSTKASEVRNRGNEDEDSFHGIDNNSTKTLPKSTSVEQKGRHMAIQEDSSLKTQNLNGNICTLSSVESKSNEKVYMPASSDSGLNKGKPGLNTLQKKLKKSLTIYIDSVKQNQGCSGQNLVLQNKDIQDGNNCMISSRHSSVSRDITSKNKVPVNVTRKRPSVSTAEQMQPSLLEAQDSIKKSFSHLPEEKRRTKKKICDVSPNNERCATKNAPTLSNIQDMPKYTTDSVQKQKDCHDSNFSYESMQKSKNFELIIMPINPNNNSSVHRAKEGLNMIINKKSSGQPKYTISNPLGKNVSNPPSSHAHLYESSSEKPHRAKKWDKHDSDSHKPTSTNKVKPDIHVEKSNKHSFDCRTCSAHTDKPKVVVEKTPYSYLGLTEVSAFKDSDDDDEDSDCAVDTAESSTNLSMEHEVVKRRKRFRTSCSEVVVRGSKVQRQSEEESNDETDRSHNSDEGIEELEEPTRLADIPCIASEIHESPDELLQTLHGILFGTSGVCHNKATLQKMIRNILNFSGFPFIEGSESYNSKLKRLKRLHFQFLSEIESILFGSCVVSRSDAAEKILNFLMRPTRTEAECLRKTKACKLKPEDLEQYERLKREILEGDGTFPIVLVKKMKVDEIERYLYPEANDLTIETDLSNSSYDNSPEMISGNLTAGIGSISEDPDFIPMPSPRKSNGPRQATNGPRQATNGLRQATNGPRQATNGIHTKGRLLKSFAEIAANIANADQKILSLLHVLLFGNDGDLGTRRQHILEFSGFSSSHQNYDMKNRKRFLRLISSSDLKSVCKILHLNFPDQEKDSMIRGLLQFIRAPCEANLTLQPRIRGPEKASKRKAPSPLPFTKPSTRSENAKKPLSRNGSSSTSFSDASFSPVSAASASSESNMSMEFRSSTVCQRLQYTLRSDLAPRIVSAQNHGCSTYQNSRNEVSSRESLSINTASASSSAPKVNVPSGKPLESFETIRFNIECATPDDLTELYDILFVKPCDNFEIHQKILQFRGFDFNQDSTEFHFRKTLLSYMNFDSLKKIAKFLNLLDDYTFMHKGELENRIMKFFVDLKDMKQGSYSSSPGKRTHIVRLSEQTNSLLTIHEVSQPSTSSGSSSQGDTQPLKIKEDLSPIFSSCSLSESHPLVGRLKADLSSSSEDETESTTPLITFANHPSDTRLRKDIREILYFKNFNITMKELIAMVFAKYPKYDLRYRSNFIKSKARHILSNLHRQ